MLGTSRVDASIILIEINLFPIVCPSLIKKFPCTIITINKLIIDKIFADLIENNEKIVGIKKLTPKEKIASIKKA